jgi:hypothetical protein
MLDDFTAAAYWTVVACKNILFLGGMKTQDTLLGQFYTLGNQITLVHDNHLSSPFVFCRARQF